jgi:ureidoacrylate peracid hydrolase
MMNAENKKAAGVSGKKAGRVNAASTSCYIPGEHALPKFVPTLGRMALLLIDMQYACAHPLYGVGARVGENERRKLNWFFKRIANTVTPNLKKLLALSRKARIPIIHTRVAGQSSNGRDMGWRLTMLGFAIGENAKEAEILPDLLPREGEILLSKKSSDAFITTALDSILRNLNIEYLVVGGVVTNGCVESTVRTAGDLGYKVWLLEDACAAHSPPLHRNALRNLQDNWALIRCTADVEREVFRKKLNA